MIAVFGSRGQGGSVAKAISATAMHMKAFQIRQFLEEEAWN